MKQVITLILSLALFVPHMAKLMAYVDCTYVMISNSDPNLCDCNRIVDNEAIPAGPDQPDKQKEISLKADWKYVAAVTYCFHSSIAPQKNLIAVNGFHYHPQQVLASIFHPPRC